MEKVQLTLRKGCDARLKAGHCWVYSNEVDVGKQPLKTLLPGVPVDLLNAQGRWLGSGYCNPNSLIAARLVSRDRKHCLSRSLLVHRLKIALAMRERFHTKPFYRLVFGESDGLPGLVVDRFADVLVVQINTAGMECLRHNIVAALAKVFGAPCVMLRNDSAVRASEGLDRYVEVALGELPETMRVEESDTRFEVSTAESQKTGWFFDQADNRKKMRKYVAGRRVLDVCSYVGGWGVQAAKAGAREVFCVDSSAAALDQLQRNAQINGVEARVAALEGDAFEALRELRTAHERFDVVILDPPAFIKRRKDLKEGTLAYRRLNQAALQLLTRDGILITSSCSHHMSAQSLLEVTQKAGRHLDRSLQLLERGFQALDHPVHPAIAETAYLKTFYLRVIPTF